jgi:hypothetical protein
LTIFRAFVLIALAALSACAGAAPLSCVGGTQPMTKLELFFGGNIGSATGVSDADWRRFLADEVTPRFPDGFSVVDVQGQYRNAAGMVIAEESRELMVIVASARDGAGKANAIRDAYKTRFRQESVLLVQSQVCAAF